MGSEGGLRKRVERYLRCRYWMLRERDLPSGNALTPLLEAEEALWEALTGERDLIEAMRTLGSPMSVMDGGTLGEKAKPRKKAKKPRRGRARKGRQRAKLRSAGFFD